jgi:hypothetical protein
MNRRLLVIVAGLSLLIPAWIGLFSSGVPTLYAPLPTLTILPAFMLSVWHLQSLAILVPSVLFFLWSPGLLFRQDTNMPKRTMVLLGFLSVLTIVYFLFEWNEGQHYQGAHYTTVLCLFNAVWLGLLWGVLIHCRRRPSFRGNLFLHWLLFVWLAWYAWPYLGELP